MTTTFPEGSHGRALEEGVSEEQEDISDSFICHNLTELLHKEAGPYSKQFFIPFLDLNSILKLSQCCHGLLDTRLFLPHVTVFQKDPEINSLRLDDGMMDGLLEIVVN